MNYGKKGVRQKQRALNSKAEKISHKFWITLLKLILICMIGAVICGVSAGIGIFKGILASTPNIHLGDVVATGQATVVYDSAGNEIDQYVSANSNRLRVEDINQLPDHLGKAFVAIEDERFYQHNGIDFKGIVRAGWQFFKTGGDEAQGASTITQQLLKNTVFTEWTSEGHNKIKKIKRKLQEQYLALEISKYYTKDQVLLEYMNAINLGQNTLGVEAASKRYFGKSASELTISESAVIACITQNPSGYNPIRFPEENAKRRKTCLDKMEELGFITKAQHDEAIADTEDVYQRIGLYDIDYRESSVATSGSYFSDALFEQVREDLINIAGYNPTLADKLLTAGGLSIESTMDPSIQSIADEEFANPDNFPEQTHWYLDYALTIWDSASESHNFSKENMMSWFQKNVKSDFNLIFKSQEDAYEAIDKYRGAMMESLEMPADSESYDESVNMTPQPQCAIVVSDQTTGYVVAIVGGVGNKEGRRTLNRATASTRSPGSTFKVLAAFAPALDSAGQTLATVYNDAPFNYDDGTPVKNWYTTGYRGINSIREAIRESMNIVAVKTQTVITPQLGYDYLLNFGFTTLTDGVVKNGKVFTDIRQPIALGGLTNGVTPLELNAGYATIANLGTYVQPKLYKRVLDSDGNVILDNTVPVTRRVLKETTAFLLTDAMKDVVKGGGTGASTNFGNMAIAGKTGTSTKYVDVWFAGFTPYYTCTVWTGYDNNVSLNTSKDKKYNESNLSKVLWKAVMKRVHEELPVEQFAIPQGLVQATICTQSGLLAIPGLCDDCTRTEYFAEDNVPEESCTVHFEGEICNFDWLPATPECPFKVYSRATLPLVEDPSLISGSTMLIENPDGTETVTSPNTATHCQHDAEFFTNPDYEIILNSQASEIQRRNEAAAAAAAAAAAGQ